MREELIGYCNSVSYSMMISRTDKGFVMETDEALGECMEVYHKYKYDDNLNAWQRRQWRTAYLADSIVKRLAQTHILGLWYSKGRLRNEKRGYVHREKVSDKESPQRKSESQLKLEVLKGGAEWQRELKAKKKKLATSKKREPKARVRPKKKIGLTKIKIDDSVFTKFIEEMKEKIKKQENKNAKKRN